MATVGTFCKLVEEQENGDLKLLTDNLQQLVAHVKEEVTDIPIVLLGIIGPKSSGKSIYTNLIAEYLKYDGKMWTKAMREGGLKGFSFGEGDNQAENVDGLFKPEEDERGGVYFWPEFFLLEHCEGKKLLWIVHVHLGNKCDAQREIWEESVTKFVGIVCSRIVDIIWKDMSVSSRLQESKQLQNYLCQSRVHLVRGSTTGTLGNGADIPLNSKMSSFVNISEFSQPLHDHMGVIKWTGMKQTQGIEKFIKAVIDETELHPKTFTEKSTVLKIPLIEGCLKYHVDLINAHKRDDLQLLPVPCVWEKSCPALNGVSGILQPVSKINVENTADKQIEAKSPQILDREQMRNDSVGSKSGLDESNLNTTRKRRKSSEKESRVAMESPAMTMERNSTDKMKFLERYDEKSSTRRNLKFLKKTLTRWINSTLTKENVAQICQIFDTLPEKMIDCEMDRLKHMGMSGTHAEKILEDAKLQENFLKMRAKVEKLQTGLTYFCSGMNTQFQDTPFFSESDLRQKFEEVKEQGLIYLEDSDIMVELFDFGCIKLISEYEADNKRGQEDADISLECIEQLRKFYQDEMEHVFKSKKHHHNPNRLASVHAQLKAEIYGVLEDAIGHYYEALRQDLSIKLDEDFNAFQRKNLDKIVFAQQRLTKLIMKLKGNYEIRMDALLESNPNGVTSSVFDLEHEQAENEAATQFTEGLERDVGMAEPAEIHMRTLLFYIGKCRQVFEEENEAALESQSHSHQNADGHLEHGGTLRSSQTPTLEPEELKPPLLFHLTYSKIGMGSYNNNSIVEDVVYTPAIVGLTTKEEWIFGNEIVKAAMEEGYIQKLWPISDYLGTSPKQAGIRAVWKDRIYTGGRTLDITIEFLLAMLLADLKTKFEREQQGWIVSSTMIAVPFWFPSFQRQQVLDAAKMAGFDQVKLVNENSASAYFMYSSKLASLLNDTVVISENSEKMDISLYGFDRKKKKLTMKGHSGDYEMDLKNAKDSNWVMGILNTFMKLIGMLNNRLEAEDVAIQETLQRWRLCLEQSKKNYPVVNSKNYVVLICCESAKWTNLLSRVGQKIGDTSIHSESVIQGMAAIHENLKYRKFEDIVQDGIPYYLNVYPSFDGNRKELLRKLETISKNPKQELKCVHEAEAAGRYPIVQENATWKQDIGTIIIKTLECGFENIEISMFRTQDGIFDLKRVEWVKNSISNLRSTRKEIGAGHFQWVRANLSSDSIRECKMRIQDVQMKASVAGKLANERRMALSRGQELEHAVSMERKGNFPSDVVKTLVLNTIREAIAILEKSAELTEAEIKQKMSLFEKMNSIYKIP